MAEAMSTRADWHFVSHFGMVAVGITHGFGPRPQLCYAAVVTSLSKGSCILVVCRLLGVEIVRVRAVAQKWDSSLSTRTSFSVAPWK